MKKEIGFSSQRIRLLWLKKTAMLAMAGISGNALAKHLDSFIGDTLSNSGSRGSRDKVITVLKRIWDPDQETLKLMRHDGFDLLRRLNGGLDLAVHWGMIMAAYPYWGETARSVGRLLKLQNTVSSQEIRRRMQESFGDRETVARATRNVVRSFVDWGVLKEEGQKGVYVAGLPLLIEDDHLKAWMIEALLYNRSNRSAHLNVLFTHPGFFPFKITPANAGAIAAGSSRLEILRHGLDEELVMIRKASGSGLKNES